MTAALAGFFGKLPARGDFVAAGLSTELVTAWDNWAQQRLVESRDTLGEDWTTLWLTTPAWRFALPAGQCGTRTITGVLMPSVDRVGRYFPLLAAVEGAGSGRDPSRPQAARFHDAVEAACRAARDRNWSPDTLLAGLAEVEAPDDAPADTGAWWTMGGPHVAAGGFEASSLPDRARFLQMLRR